VYAPTINASPSASIDTPKLASSAESLGVILVSCVKPAPVSAYTYSAPLVEVGALEFRAASSASVVVASGKAGASAKPA
jgi:hypothetical protein